MRPVIVSGHALSRARERLSGIPRGELEEFMRADVRAAIRDGRVAKRRPGWLAFSGEQVRLRGQSPRRIAWSHDLRRAYVIRGTRDERGQAIVVLTVMVAVTERAA